MTEHIVEAPAPGKVLRVHASEGQPLAEGDRICILEALKMELPIVAPVGGTVKSLPISPGQSVEAGDPLAVIEEQFQDPLVLKATWFVLAGMGIVFATLSLLALVMTALNRWLGPEPEAKKSRNA